MDGRSLEEQQLVASYHSVHLLRNQSHSNAYRFLLRPENAEHWWCQHYELTKELCEVLVHQEHLQPRQIWQTMSSQLGSCSDCISSYHTAQAELLSGQYELASVRPLLTALWHLDKQRLLSWLTPQQQHQQAQQQDVAGPSPQLVLALFEVLGYAYFLDDWDLCNAVVQQLVQLQWQVATDEGSRFPGFYKLLAHPDGAVRAQVLEIVVNVGQFSLQDLADSNMTVVLDTWLTTLQQQVTPAAAIEDELCSQSQLIPASDKQQWVPANVWFGLKIVLGLMEAECLPVVLADYTNLLTLVLCQSCPSAAWAQQQHQQHPQPPPGLAPEASMEHRHALGCLHILLKYCKQELWQLLPALPPGDLVQELRATCWRVAGDTGLLKLLVQVLQAVVTSLLPHMAVADDAFEDIDNEAGVAAAGPVVAADQAKLAVATCLRLLLVQLAGSSAVSLLGRALALQAGLSCCMAALQSPSCPGTATFSHLWGPVCADVLYVQPEQQHSQQSQWGTAPGELKQHQAPGLVKLIPLMGQMDELRRKVVDAAADVVALALQVDAAVLQAVLEPNPSNTPASKSSLVPGALDIIEMALNNATDYICSPSLWLALAGCGNSTVSATYAAVAAQLAPLTATAAAKAGSTLLAPGTQQQLETSLVLPNAETVDLDSDQHMLYALDYAGWLHGQLMKAAVRHLHTCSVRSRFFILPRSQRPSSGNSRGPKGSQPTISALYQQLAGSNIPAADSTAGEAYGLVIRSCCSLLLLGRSGPAAAVTAGAELALLSSCGLGVGELGVALQQHLLAPGSECAEHVVEAMQDAVQEVQRHKLQQVVCSNPDWLTAVLQFTQYSLAAAIQHGLEVMLPLLANYLPHAWQLATYTLSSCQKMLHTCRACGMSTASKPNSSSSNNHVGPAVGRVLKALLECLPTAWQCYQALVEQRCEQRRYMLSSDPNDSEGLLFSPGGSQGKLFSPSQQAGQQDDRLLQAELQREMKWMVHLLQLGNQVFSGASSQCSTCVVAAVAGEKLLPVWQTAVEGIVKITSVPLSKAVKAAATELMSANSTSLNTLWLAKLFPTAAPGNLASTGLGSWPSTLLASAPTASKAAAGTLPAAGAAAKQEAKAPGADDVIVIDSDDWVGEWLSDEEQPSENSSEQEHQQHSSREHSTEQRQRLNDPGIVVDSDEEHQQAMSPRQQLHSWPWLKQQAHQQEQQQEGVKKGVSKLLHSSKSLNTAPSQLQQQQQAEPPSLFDVLGSSRKGRRSSVGASSDEQFKALLASLDKATVKTAAEADGRPAKATAAAFGKAAAAAAPAATGGGGGGSALSHLLPAKESKQQQQKPPRPKAAAPQPDNQQLKPKPPQQQKQRPRASAADADYVNVDSLWPDDWPSSGFKPTGDAAGGSSSAGWGVGKFNFNSSSRPRQWQQGASLAGLSKADQLRADLLGRAPVGGGGERGREAAATRRSEKAEQDRLMAFINQQIELHAGGQPQQQGQQEQKSSRQSGDDAAAASQQQPAANLDKQRHELQAQRARKQQLFLEQRERERQQREQQEKERKEKKQAEQQQLRARSAEVLRHHRQEAAKQAAVPPAAVNLISDDALFAQAAAASKGSKLAASLQQKRHSVVTLSGGALAPSSSGRRYDSLLRPVNANAPGVRLLGGPRGREATVLGARYYPPLKMDEVVSELLSWGYLGAVGASNRSSSSNAAGAAFRQKLLEAGKVPLSFESRAHYCHVFKGLLLEELRAGLAASHEELVNTGGGGARGGRGGSGGFKCLPLLIDNIERQSSVHVIRARVDTSALQPWERDSPRTDDYILLTKVQLTSASQLSEEQLPRSHLSGLVLDASLEQPGVRLVTFKVATASAGSDVMANYWQQLLTVRAKLWLTVITSLVPNFREFQALTALQQSQHGHRLFTQVLSPKPPTAPPFNALDSNQHATASDSDTAAAAASTSSSSSRAVSTISGGLRHALMAAYNQSQQAAVAACLDKRWPFVLVQGPPGTGKTSAIVGILSALLASNASSGAAAGSDSQSAQAAGRGTAASKKQKPPNSRTKKAAAAAADAGPSASGIIDPSAAQAALKLGVIPAVRILVCAQSNAAIDELATRLANGGVWGGQGVKRPPAMVRLGRSDATHKDVLMFHVDSLADSHVAQQQQQPQPAQQQQGGLDSAQARLQELRDQLQRVEQQLADLAKGEKLTAAAAAAEADPGVQQQQGSKRTTPPAADFAVKYTADGRAAKKQRASDGSAAPTSAAPKPTPSDGSGSDMDVSDGEREPPANGGKQKDRISASKHCSRSRSRSSSRDKHRHSRRDSSRDRHRSSRESDRHDKNSRSSRRSSRDRRSSRSRSRERRREKQARRHKSRSRSRSKVRGSKRSRYRHSSRSSSRERGRSRRSRSPSRRSGQDRSSRETEQGCRQQHQHQQQVLSSEPGVAEPSAQERPQQRQPVNAAVSESLLRDQQRSLLAQLRTAESEAQRRAAGGGRELARAKRGARQAVIKSTEIVMCTLSAAGGDLLNCFPASEAPLFDVLVVDEAAQALEPATLIPMQMLKPGTGRVVLVGDPCQLPPTVLSRAAEAALLAQSLFERFARAGWPVTLLREQYRMHPHISAFPSRFFYDGQLLDGAGITAVSKGARFHSKLAFRPFVMWDCREGRERGAAAGAGGSLRNIAEAQMAATLVAGVLSSYRGDVGSIAVISPYKAQVSTLREEFRRALGGEAAITAANIEFGTVDGFQGREADIVVFSCVRAQPEAAATSFAAASLSQGAGTSTAAAAVNNAPAAGAPRVGFLADVRRMNVGLTRGRRAVWVVCHADTLAASSAWRPLLQEARSRGVLLEARAPFNRLLVASEKQLQGSYWTPGLPALAPDAATAVAGGAKGVDANSAAASKPAAGAVAAAVQPRKHNSAHSTAAAGQRLPPEGQSSGHQRLTTADGDAAGRDGRGVRQQQHSLQQGGSAPSPPPPPAAAAPPAPPAPPAGTTSKPGVPAGLAKGATSGALKASKAAGDSVVSQDPSNAKLHAVLQQRLQKPKHDKERQQLQSRVPVSSLANRRPSHQTSGPQRATDAVGGKGSGRPAAAGARDAQGPSRALAPAAAVPGISGSGVGGARTAAGAPAKSGGSSTTALPAAGSGGQGSRVGAHRQKLAGSSANTSAAASGLSSDQDRLKEALMRRIQQQKMQKK